MCVCVYVVLVAVVVRLMLCGVNDWCAEASKRLRVHNRRRYFLGARAPTTVSKQCLASVFICVKANSSMGTTASQPGWIGIKVK